MSSWGKQASYLKGVTCTNSQCIGAGGGGVTQLLIKKSIKSGSVFVIVSFRYDGGMIGYGLVNLGVVNGFLDCLDERQDCRQRFQERD
jgi:hypothetical protein